MGFFNCPQLELGDLVNLKGDSTMEHQQKSEPAANLLLPAMTLREKDNIAVVTLDDKEQKVNTLSSKLIPQFEEILSYVKKSKTVSGLVIISGKKDNFVAGADIHELEKTQSVAEAEALSKNAQEFFTQLEDLEQPVVAAIHGSCLGGGLELTLACDYRIGTDHPKTVLGLPEVMLGLLPGAGGTQRLPRLIGLPDALNLMLTGMSVKAAKAKKLGILDHVVPPEGLEDVAIQAAQQLVEGKLSHTKKKSASLMGTMEKVSMGRKFILSQALKKVEAKSRGLYPAPKAIIDVVGYGLDHGFDKGLIRERQEFARLSQTSECAGLISLFNGQTELKKNTFGEPKVKVDHVGVLGGGLMGAGIALVSLQKGMKVRLRDLNEEQLAKARKSIWKPIESRIKRRISSIKAAS